MELLAVALGLGSLAWSATGEACVRHEGGRAALGGRMLWEEEGASQEACVSACLSDKDCAAVQATRFPANRTLACRFYTGKDCIFKLQRVNA